MNSNQNEQQSWKPDKYVRVLQNALEAYEKDHPHWQIEVLFSFIKRSLLGLRQQIADRNNNRVTWDSPFTEFQYPVQWDWSVKDVKAGKLVTGKFTKQNTRDPETARKTLAEIMVGHLNVLALQNFTNRVWLETRGDAYSVFLPPELGDELQATKHSRHRQELLEEFSHPFSIGAASIDFGTDELQNGKRISNRAARQLAKIDKLIAIRRIGVSGDINGHHIEMSLVFQIHPLTIDCEKQTAFHRITVGLFIPPEMAENDVVTTTPSDWSENDIETLWKEFLEEVDKIADQLIPKAESQDSTIYLVNVNVQLGIPLTSSRPEESNAAIKQIFEDLAQGRQIREFTVRPAESITAPASGINALIPAKQQKENGMPTVNPWRSGSFYLFAIVVIMAVLAVMGEMLNAWILPLLILGGVLLVTIIGAFQLRNDRNIEEKNFLTLMKLAFQKMPLLGKLLSKSKRE
ncbi:MAG: hypothetical protein HZC54_07690 [Verrucomicrobia bacterium]|nr:hypothetical protein [Verrucomicrobiota bacterium]